MRPIVTEQNTRRTEITLAAAGVDISADINKYLKSFTFTDNESGETDDLQLQLDDREVQWLTQWLNGTVKAAQSTTTANGSLYKVTAKIGLNIRAGPGTSYKIVGAYSYGALITVGGMADGWASVTYGGQTAYVSADYITLANGAPVGGWAVGQTVTVTGQPQYTSCGEGNPGAALSNYTGKITYLNIKTGVPYPIHVDQKGWFAESQTAGVTQTTGTQSAASVDSFGKGLELRAALKRVGLDRLDCGVFFTDSIKFSGPPAAVTIKAVSLPFNGIRLTPRSSAWENYTLSGIAMEIAARHGLACSFEAGYNPKYEREDQTNQSDIDFLRSLCEMAGIVIKVTGKTLVLYDEAANDAQTPFETIDRRDAGYIKYELSTAQRDRQYAACRVTYEDVKNKRTITGLFRAPDADPDGPVYEVKRKVSGTREAEELAKRLLRSRNKNGTLSAFTFAGDVKWTAGRAVTLKNWGAYDGVYIIKTARHSVTNGGYTTDITLRKRLVGY